MGLSIACGELVNIRIDFIPPSLVVKLIFKLMSSNVIKVLNHLVQCDDLKLLYFRRYTGCKADRSF